MKLRLFATAAIAAAALSAPAFAQTIGSVGVTAAQNEVDAGGFEIDGQTYAIDGSAAFKVSPDWTITGNAAFGITDGDLSDDGLFTAGAAATYAGADWRVGPTIGYAYDGDEDQWSFGGVAQKYIGDVTLSGSVNYANIDDIDADVWTVGGEVRYFVSDNFRVNGGLTWATADAGGVEADGWSAGVGGEYQFAGTPLSLTGGYSHAKVDDADLDVDTFSIGLRMTFGGDLKARDRSGADLGTGASPFASIF